MLQTSPVTCVFDPNPSSATVHRDPHFNPQAVSVVLRKAMQGLGTDEQAIIKALTSINTEQRQELADVYKGMYGRDLVEEFKSELSGHFKKIILALMMSKYSFLASEMRNAMKGLGTNESTLIEILTSLDNEEIAALNFCYNVDFDRLLEQDLASETSGDFKHLLALLAHAVRDEQGVPNDELARTSAVKLIQAGVMQWGTDEDVFNRIFCKLSHSQLCLVFAAYQTITGKTIEETIESEMSGDFKRGLLALVQVARSKVDYLATRLYDSMKGLGTNESTLTRIIVTTCEENLVEIKHRFLAKYGQPLAQFVEDDCSGDYKRTLLALIK